MPQPPVPGLVEYHRQQYHRLGSVITNTTSATNLPKRFYKIGAHF